MCPAVWLGSPRQEDFRGGQIPEIMLTLHSRTIFLKNRHYLDIDSKANYIYSGVRTHTRAKVRYLSKNSHFKTIIFDKNSQFRNLIFHKIHIFQNNLF